MPPGFIVFGRLVADLFDASDLRQTDETLAVYCVIALYSRASFGPIALARFL